MRRAHSMIIRNSESAKNAIGRKPAEGERSVLLHPGLFVSFLSCSQYYVTRNSHPSDRFRRRPGIQFRRGAKQPRATSSRLGSERPRHSSKWGRACNWWRAAFAWLRIRFEAAQFGAAAALRPVGRPHKRGRLPSKLRALLLAAVRLAPPRSRCRLICEASGRPNARKWSAPTADCNGASVWAAPDVESSNERQQRKLRCKFKFSFEWGLLLFEWMNEWMPLELACKRPYSLLHLHLKIFLPEHPKVIIMICARLRSHCARQVSRPSRAGRSLFHFPAPATAINYPSP